MGKVRPRRNVPAVTYRDETPEESPLVRLGSQGTRSFPRPHCLRCRAVSHARGSGGAARASHTPGRRVCRPARCLAAAVAGHCSFAALPVAPGSASDGGAPHSPPPPLRCFTTAPGGIAATGAARGPGRARSATRRCVVVCLLGGRPTCARPSPAARPCLCIRAALTVESPWTRTWGPHIGASPLFGRSFLRNACLSHPWLAAATPRCPSLVLTPPLRMHTASKPVFHGRPRRRRRGGRVGG